MHGMFWYMCRKEYFSASEYTPCIICRLHSINAVIFSNDPDQTINVLYLGTKPMWTSFAASRKFQSHIILKPIVNISLETAS